MLYYANAMLCCVALLVCTVMHSYCSCTVYHLYRNVLFCTVAALHCTALLHRTCASARRTRLQRRGRRIDRGREQRATTTNHTQAAAAAAAFQLVRLLRTTGLSASRIPPALAPARDWDRMGLFLGDLAIFSRRTRICGTDRRIFFVLFPWFVHYLRYPSTCRGLRRLIL